MIVGRYLPGDPLKRTPAVFFGVLARVREAERLVSGRRLTEQQEMGRDADAEMEPDLP